MNCFLHLNAYRYLLLLTTIIPVYAEQHVKCAMLFGTRNSGEDSSLGPLPPVKKSDDRGRLPTIFVSLSVLVVITSLIIGFH